MVYKKNRLYQIKKKQSSNPSVFLCVIFKKLKEIFSDQNPFFKKKHEE